MAGPTYSDSFSQNAAENYERYFVPSIGRPVAASLIEFAALRPGERVLDVACGTGIVARLAAEQVGPRGTVEGLDANLDMLAVARKALPSVVWHHASAAAIPLPDANFDVVLCGMGLQFFGGRAIGLREMRRVLVPGGRLIASVPGPVPPPLEAMAASLARHFSRESASFLSAVFSLHDADELLVLATIAGFEDVEVRSESVTLQLPSPADFLWQYVHCTPMAAVLAQLDPERQEALERDFSERCSDFVNEGSLTGAVRTTTLFARR